jgi:hypothetical protein
MDLFEEMRRQNADWYTQNPIERMSDEEIQEVIDAFGLETTVQEMRAFAQETKLTATCLLCGRPSTHLIGCKGCGGGAWQTDFEFTFGDDAASRLRTWLREAMQGDPFDDQGVEYACENAYRPSGCMVCETCWHHMLPGDVFRICPVYRFFEFSRSRLRGEADFLFPFDSADQYDSVLIYWTDTWNTVSDDQERALIALWRERMLLSPLGNLNDE